MWLLPLGVAAVAHPFASADLEIEVASTFRTALEASAGLSLLYAVARATNSTLNAITLEKEQQTYEALQSTMLSTTDIVGGKLLAGVWPLLRELAMMTPFAVMLGLLSQNLTLALAFLLLISTSSALLATLALICSYQASSSKNASTRCSFWVSVALLCAPIVASLTGLHGISELSPLGALQGLYRTESLSGSGLGVYLGAWAAAQAGLWLYACSLERRARRVQ